MSSITVSVIVRQTDAFHARIPGSKIRASSTCSAAAAVVAVVRKWMEAHQSSASIRQISGKQPGCYGPPEEITVTLEDLDHG